MKQIYKLTWMLLLVLSIITPTAFSAPVSKLSTINSPKEMPTDITIGHRTNDSTGQLSISNSGIQQSIMPLIPLLNNATVTSENCSLLVLQNAAFLQFSVMDSLGKKSIIAVQLNENGSGGFTFNAGNGNELHILRNSENCTSCLYAKEMGGIVVSNCGTGTPCKHEIHFSL